MSDFEQYKKDLALEYSIIETLELSLALDVVNARQTMQYINKCISDNVTARDAAKGLLDFQLDYMKWLFNNEPEKDDPLP